MCNLYRMTKPNSEVARWFDAIDQLGGANFGEEVFPGYPGAVVADFDGDPQRITELDALIAYLQMLGTLVDFDVYQAEGDNLR